MPVAVRCPNCNVGCSIADGHAGPVRCPKCGKPFMLRPTMDSQSRDTRPPATEGDPFPVLPAEFGRYRLLKLLGRGGMGAVYLAQDSQLGRKVALKLPFLQAGGSRVERFVREARSAAGLAHPGICTVFDAGEIAGRPFLTMAYVEGSSLEDAIDPDKPMDERRAAEIVRKIALALAHAHGKGIVHRDLKPANVLMTAGGEPVVTDFGLAKQVLEVDPAEKRTQDGGILGTPAYMSPEQARGEVRSIGPASDVWSLGVILFEMLAGRLPYRGSLAVMMGQILAAPAPPLREFRPEADGRLEAICLKAMAKDAKGRFGSMEEMAEELGRFLQPVAPPPVPSPFEDLTQGETLVREPSPPPSRKRGWMIGAGVAAVVLLGLLGLTVLRMETPNGTLVVEMDDEAEARIKGGKLVVVGEDGKPKYTLTAAEKGKALAAGSYTVRVEGADGVALDTPEFVMKKGGKMVLRVRAEKRAVAKEKGVDEKDSVLQGEAKPKPIVFFSKDSVWAANTESELRYFKVTDLMGEDFMAEIGLKDGRKYKLRGQVVGQKVSCSSFDIKSKYSRAYTGTITDDKIEFSYTGTGLRGERREGKVLVKLDK